MSKTSDFLAELIKAVDEFRESMPHPVTSANRVHRQAINSIKGQLLNACDAVTRIDEFEKLQEGFRQQQGKSA